MEAIHELSLGQDEGHITRPQSNNDLSDLEKLDLSSIPPDLRPVLSKSKTYFKDKKDTYVLVDKERNLLIGWSCICKLSDNSYSIEILISPGWTHLYENFLNTLICDYIQAGSEKIKLTIKAVDYLIELTDVLAKSGFLKTEIRELLVRTIWQKVKERKLKTAGTVVPRAAPT